MKYVIQFPATLDIHIECFGDDLAFANAVTLASEIQKALTGAALQVAFRKGTITQKTPEPDCRD